MYHRELFFIECIPVFAIYIVERATVLTYRARVMRLLAELVRPDHGHVIYREIYNFSSFINEHYIANIFHMYFALHFPGYKKDIEFSGSL